MIDYDSGWRYNKKTGGLFNIYDEDMYGASKVRGKAETNRIDRQLYNNASEEARALLKEPVENQVDALNNARYYETYLNNRISMSEDRLAKVKEKNKQGKKVDYDYVQKLQQTLRKDKDELEQTKHDIKALESSIKNCGAKSGALNDTNDPDGKLRQAHADRYYKELRNRDKDYVVKSMSKNLGASEEESRIVFEHVFLNKHDLVKGHTYFDAEYDMAESFRRIIDGVELQNHDIILFKHELMEANIMKETGMGYDDAHEIVSKIYNYQKAITEDENGKGKKGK